MVTLDDLKEAIRDYEDIEDAVRSLVGDLSEPVTDEKGFTLLKATFDDVVIAMEFKVKDDEASNLTMWYDKDAEDSFVTRSVGAWPPGPHPCGPNHDCGVN